MSPRWLHWPAAGDTFTQLISGTTTSDTTTNYYVSHTNIDGDPIWDGRANDPFFVVNTSNQLQFYFVDDAARSTALSTYSSWKITAAGGVEEMITPTTSSSSRLVWQFPTGFSASTTYTIWGQP